LFVFVVFEIAP